jgi:hypothetical protein
MPWPWVGAALVWLGLIGTATALMLSYTLQPGDPASPPAQWPETSRVAREAGSPMLVMFVHPHCPCSRASVGELARLMAHCQGRVRAHALFLKPSRTSESWDQTDLWRTAAAIPGVSVLRDDEGLEARRFQVETSGDTVVYDAAGRLVFHGGMTSSRGHSGDNAGRGAIQALLLHGRRPPASTPVFGCALFGVRPSSGAETSATSNAPNRCDALDALPISAPEDGCTPPADHSKGVKPCPP